MSTEASFASSFIIGPSLIQNTMLAQYLHAQTGIECEIGDESTLQALENGLGSESILILYDCSRMPMDLFWETARSILDKTSVRLALLNANRKSISGQTLLENGVHGVFYEDDPHDLLPQGVEAISKGELWYSRKELSTYITNLRRNAPVHTSSAAISTLTPREKEILSMMSKGSSNKLIAQDLCISESTVKSHLYNIFSKIGVPNRVQATLWALSNLQ